MVSLLRKFGHNTFASLKIRNYRLYFIGQTISLSGTWMHSVAMGWLVLQMTGSGTQVGIIFALQFVPMLFLGVWGGLITDRYDKRTILYYTQITSGVLVLGLSFLVFYERITIGALYFFALLFGLIRVFDNPTRQVFVSELVGDAHLKNAVSLNATVNNLARAVGPSIAGVLIASVGMAFCFFINSATYLVTLWTLWQMKNNELYTGERVTKKPGATYEGFHYILTTPLIRNTLLMMAIIGAFVFEFQVSLPLLAEVFKGDASTYAALMTAMGIGAVVGGLFAAGRHKIAPHHLVIFIFFFGFSMILTACMPTVHFAIVGMLFVGFFSINVTSLGNTMLQLESKPSMRGRVMAVWGMAMLGSTPIGAPLIGFIGEYAGGRWGIGTGGLLGIGVALFGLLTILKKDREEKISSTIELHTEETTVSYSKLP